MKAFLMDRVGTPYYGKVWPGPVHFPDFSSEAGKAFWAKLLRDWRASGAKFMGLWTDMCVLVLTACCRALAQLCQAAARLACLRRETNGPVDRHVPCSA